MYHRSFNGHLAHKNWIFSKKIAKLLPSWYLAGMQTVKEVQKLLRQADAHPQKRFGQCFLIDLNQMQKVLEFANLPQDCSAKVLEIGPGTGSLTEELIPRSTKVVAVEIDRKLTPLLRSRLITGDTGCSTGDSEQIEEVTDSAKKRTWRVDRAEKFVLIEGDILAGKTKIAPVVLGELGTSARLVANLPFNIATPLIAECLLESWRAVTGIGGVRFDSMTFTVQQEVAERFSATTGREYGQVSVIIALLGKITLGPIISPSAFWPKPKVASRIVHIEFDPKTAARVQDSDTLQALLRMTFTQRRKCLSSTSKGRGAAFAPVRFAAALGRTNIDPSVRADQLLPEAYRDLANELTEK